MASKTTYVPVVIKALNLKLQVINYLKGGIVAFKLPLGHIPYQCWLKTWVVWDLAPC